jgi:hypothetical protein
MENNNDIQTFEEVSDDLTIVKVPDHLLPEKISSAITAIGEIDKKIKEADENAKSAQESANEAAEKKAGIFGKREAIEALQAAVVNQATALISSVNANKELFKNQKEMIGAIRNLFCLGVTSLAANRSVVRELEIKLKDASEEELSELAKKEIKTVILQLRAQEDMLKKLDNHDEIFREHKQELEKVKDRFDEFHTYTLSEIESIRSTINNKISELSQEFGKHNSLLKSDIDGLAEEMNVKVLNFEQDLVSQSDKLKSDIKNLNEGLNSKMQSISNELEESADKKVSSAYSALDPRIIDLEQYKETELARKTILDTRFYKIIIGIIAIAALICSLIPLFGS